MSIDGRLPLPVEAIANIIAFLPPSEQTRARQVSTQFFAAGNLALINHRQPTTPLRNQVFTYLDTISPVPLNPNPTPADFFRRTANLRRRTDVIVSLLLAGGYVHSEEESISDDTRAFKLDLAATRDEPENIRALLASGLISDLNKTVVLCDVVRLGLRRPVETLLASSHFSDDDLEMAGDVAFSNEHRELQVLLLAAANDVHEKNRALFLAASRGYREIVETLLASNHFSKNALARAYDVANKKGHREIMSALIDSCKGELMLRKLFSHS